MKKIYKSPDISILMFDQEDIITASSPLSDLLTGEGDNIFEFDQLLGMKLFDK